VPDVLLLIFCASNTPTQRRTLRAVTSDSSTLERPVTRDPKRIVDHEEKSTTLKPVHLGGNLRRSLFVVRKLLVYIAVNAMGNNEVEARRRDHPMVVMTYAKRYQPCVDRMCGFDALKFSSDIGNQCGAFWSVVSVMVIPILSIPKGQLLCPSSKQRRGLFIFVPALRNDVVAVVEVPAGHIPTREWAHCGWSACKDSGDNRSRIGSDEECAAERDVVKVR
jgi:hypothetical protein